MEVQLLYQKYLNLLHTIKIFMHRRNMVLKGFFENIEDIRIFFRFLLSYIILLILILAVENYSFNVISKTAKEDYIKSNSANLERNIALLDSRLMEINKMKVNLSNDADVTYFWNKTLPLEGKDYSKLADLQQELNTYRAMDDLLGEIYICFKSMGMLLSSRTGAMRIDDYYGQVFKYEELSYADWYGKYFETYHTYDIWPAQHIIMEGKGYNFLTYITSFPIGYSNLKGNFVAMLNESKVQEYFRNIYVSGSFLFIKDNDGNILTRYGDSRIDVALTDEMSPDSVYERVVGDRRMFVITARSQFNGWLYIWGLPESFISQKVKSTREVSLLTNAIALFLGLILAFSLSYYNGKPLKRIIQVLKKFAGIGLLQKSGGYRFIENTLASLVAGNDSLKEELRRQNEQLKISLFERLLRGGIDNISDMDSMLENNSFDIANKSFVIINCKIKSSSAKYDFESKDELNAARVLVKDIVGRLLQDSVYIHNTESDKITILYNISYKEDHGAGERLAQILLRIADELDITYNMTVVFGIGSQYEAAGNISDSFLEANKALDYRFSKTAEKKVIWYDDLPKERNGYYYPITLEMKIINFSRLGLEKEVIALLNSVYEANFVENSLSNREITQLVNELKGTVIKLMNDRIFKDIEPKEKIAGWLNEQDLREPANAFFENLKDIYARLCGYIKECGSYNNENMITKVKKYIDDNFTRQDLSLYTVAREFNFSESYFSIFFKEKAGENFLNYVEKQRLSFAINLINQKKHTIADIANKVGYTNKTTFYRAFKRNYGVSPHEYGLSDLVRDE